VSRNLEIPRWIFQFIFISFPDAYSTEQLAYEWQSDDAVGFVPGMTLSQFDLVSFSQRNFTLTRREGDFSALQVSFNLQRHTGYFLIQVNFYIYP
jgi:gamma-aminobutyric acid receptor subunit alpha